MTGKMKLYIGLQVLAMVIITSSCASQPSEPPPTDPSLSGSPGSSKTSTHVIRRAENEADYPNHGITTTKATPQPGDNFTSSSALMIPLTVDDLIEKSDAIVLGKVVDIFPARQVDEAPWEMTIITDEASWDIRIITDVVIEVERHLYGKPQSPNIVLHVYGGRIDGLTIWMEDEPVFNLGEEVALFLYRPQSEITPPDGFETNEYYRVTGSVQGKLGYKDGTMVTLEGNSVTISEVEQKITSIHGGQ